VLPPLLLRSDTNNGAFDLPALQESMGWGGERDIVIDTEQVDSDK